MHNFSHLRSLTVLCILGGAAISHASEHITLTSGFELTCLRHEALPDGHVRLYSSPEGYMDVAASSIKSVAVVNDPPPSPVTSAAAVQPSSSTQDIRQIMEQAGAHHNLDVDLLASVVRAESAGNHTAVSRTGARGLMQLMPGTAAELGVKDTFAPDENINGGTAYLDQLLTRYHDNLALALAAYNAGPAAVDRYHGVPPYRETRAYVARVIHEFNRRKIAQMRNERAAR